MGFLRLTLTLLVVAACSQAATLERLSFESMAQQSTSIVRGRVSEARAVRAGGIIYTLYRIEVSAWWKGTQSEGLEIATIGGSHDGVTQRFGGSPSLQPGTEYVAFLWEGASGRSQILGLTQGLFEVVESAVGEPMLLRQAIEDVTLVAEAGREIGALKLSFTEFEGKIRKALSAQEASTP